jgi:hypothetical protein
MRFVMLTTSKDPCAYTNCCIVASMEHFCGRGNLHLQLHMNCRPVQMQLTLQSGALTLWHPMYTLS